MPDPRRALSRVTAKTQGFESASSGPAALTREDVMAALGAVGDGFTVNVLLAKWAGDEDAQRAVVAELTAKLERDAHDLGWQVSFSRLAAVASAATLEFVSPRKCPECRGRLKVFLRSKRKGKGVREFDCYRCEGRGYIQRTGRARAEAVGVDPKEWRVRWEARYGLAMSHLTSAEGRGLRRVSLALMSDGPS